MSLLLGPIMKSRTAVFLFYGLIWKLASSESSLETPHENLRQPDLHCNFEKGQPCSWKDVSAASGMLRWNVHDWTDRETSTRTGPPSDHTTGHGDFLSIRSSNEQGPGKALFESPLVVTNNQTCLSFWYYMHGFSVGGLNVYKSGHGDVRNQLFTMFGPQGQRWYRAVINTGDGIFKIQIEGTFTGYNVYGNVVIDDIAFSYHACKEDDSTLLKDQPRFDCDFDQDFCSWILGHSYAMTWRIIHVPSESKDRNALPPESNGTSFIKLVWKPRGYYYQTTLQGPSISVGSERACLSFWYKIDNPEIRQLQIGMHDHGEHLFDGSRNTLFSTDFNSGPVWLKGLVTLPERDHFYLVIRASARRKDESLIALDDVRLTRGGPCTEGAESVINCDFERDFCRWYMTTKKDEGDWVRARGPTPTNVTGPKHDHTTGDGYYIFFDASEVQEAVLYSSPFSVDSSGACLSFWYYMHGADVHMLQLHSQGSFRYSFTPIDWLLEGPQGDQWVQHNISLEASHNIRLVFTATRSYFPRGDIALDDISITFGAPCESDLEKEISPVPTTFHPEITEFETRTDSVTTPTTTEAPLPETPKLFVKGNINPIYNNSQIELVCQHDEGHAWIRWYKKARNSGFLENEAIPNRYEKHLVFDEIHPNDTGIYSCVVQVFYGQASNASEEVYINVEPDKRPSPLLRIDKYGDGIHSGDPIDVEVNSVVTLVCGDEINGGEYHWKTKSNAFKSINLPKDRILVLNGTQPKHSGDYSCQISKDGYWTARSNKLNLVVRPGRWCESRYDCYGDNYYRNCANHRCECRRETVLHGRGCQRRPERPKITTYPKFLEFGIGESFYLVCEANEPAPTDLTYTMKSKRNHDFKEKSLNILKISNVTESDTGFYGCYVTTFDGINSMESSSIYIQIKDFIDLNCDFTKDLCSWSQKDETDTATFATASSMDERSSGPSGPFIQLDASNTTVTNRAVLVSPTIDRMALKSCLRFWYRMHGPDVLSLSVWRYIYSEGSYRFEGSKLWTAIGERGEVWFKQDVTVGIGSKFYITIEAIGQAAIDDVTFTYRGGC